MTEKRFILIEGFKKGTHTGIWDKWKQNNQRVGDELWLGEVVAMLNEGVAIVEENEQLKDALNQRTDQCDKYYKENEQLKYDATVLICSNQEYRKENEQLKSENKRLTDKLNKTALELVDECISQGKATEISEMSYREFLDYRAENGKPMELHL